MEYYVAPRVGRTVVLRLDKGELVLPCLQKMLRELDISDGVIVSGVATFDRLRLHYATSTDYPVEFVYDDREGLCLEVTGMNGYIADYEPHIHCVVSDEKGAHAGHLHEECRALFLCEIVVQELLGLKLARKPNGLGGSHLEEK